jgi:predicted secreted protein
MYTELDIIGFSTEGDYLAYEVSGWDTDSNRAFSLIQIVDIDKNDFVAEDFLAEAENGKAKLDSGVLRESAYRQANTTLQQYRIVAGNKGTLVYEQSRTAVVQEVVFSTAGAKAPEQQYRLVITPRTVDSSSCDHLAAAGRTAKIFTLSLYMGQRGKILQRDTVLFRSRNCPYDYGIYRIYTFDKKLAVFLHSFTSGPNVYKLIVSGTLEFPPVSMRAMIETPDQVAEYKYAGNEETLDSGHISVRVVADSSTYDEEHNSDTYRKLVVIDRRGTKPVVRAIVLPPTVSFGYPYYIHDVFDGDRKLVLITGKSSFYIYDVLDNGLSGPVFPGKDKPWIGVDGRSGNLVRCRFSNSGTILTGAIVHQGNFVYDIIDPMTPQEIEYAVDFNTGE